MEYNFNWFCRCWKFSGCSEKPLVSHYFSYIFFLSERQEETQRAPSHWFTPPNACNSLGLGQAKTRSQEFNPGFPMWVAGTESLGPSLLLPWICSRRNMGSGARASHQAQVLCHGGQASQLLGLNTLSPCIFSGTKLRNLTVRSLCTGNPVHFCFLFWGTLLILDMISVLGLLYNKGCAPYVDAAKMSPVSSM